MDADPDRDIVDVEEMLFVWLGVWDCSGLAEATWLPDTVPVITGVNVPGTDTDGVWVSWAVEEVDSEGRLETEEDAVWLTDFLADAEKLDDGLSVGVRAEERLPVTDGVPVIDILAEEDTELLPFTLAEEDDWGVVVCLPE